LRKKATSVNEIEFLTFDFKGRTLLT